MAKICEYESVKCPFCGSEDVKDHYRGSLKFNFTTPDQRCQASAPIPVHVICCVACAGRFSIPCED